MSQEQARTTPADRNGDRGPRSLRQRRREQTRADLVAGVIAVISGSGLDELTIEAIARAAGVSRGTVYAHFPAGYTELVTAAYASIGRRIAERTDAEASAASTWRDELSAHARAMIELAADARIGHFYNVTGPALVQESRGIGSGAGRAQISAALARARDAGELRSGADPEALAVLLIGAVRESAIAVASGSLEPRRALEAFTDLVDGLSGPRAGTREAGIG